MDLQNQQVRGIAKDASLFYKNSMYVANEIFPIVDNAPKTGKVAKYHKGDWFRDEAAIRAPGDSVYHGKWEIDYVNFDPKQFAFGSEVTFEDLRAEGFADGTVPPVDMEVDAVEYATDKVMLKREVRTRDVIFNQNWSGGSAEDAAGLWSRTSAAGTNTFVADIRQRRATIKNNTGITPNRLMFDWNTWEHIQDNPDLIARVPTTKDRIINQFDLATYLGVEKVIIADAIRNTANKKVGEDAFTSANLWEENTNKGGAFLYYAPPKMGRKVRAAGGTFRMKMFNGAPVQVVRRRNDEHYRWDYEVLEETDIVVMDSYLGFRWVDTIAT